jgi:hypothetical protein
LVVDTPEARDELQCPRCGYSLRGLGAVASAPQDPPAGNDPAGDTVPPGREPSWSRCPECGFVCYWKLLLHAGQTRHPYVFERHTNPKGYLRTLLGGLFPRRFWSVLDLTHSLRPGRLVIYWFITSLVLLGSCVAGRYAIEFIQASYRHWVSGVPISASSRLRLSEFFQSPDLEFEFALVGCLWPWATFLTLLLFQASMRRARVRAGHVLRCAIYAGDVFVLFGLVSILLHAVLWARSGYVTSVSPGTRIAIAGLSSALLMLAAAYRIGVAYRDYLHFDHPWSTALASQTVVFLLFLTVAAAGARQFFWMFQ